MITVATVGLVWGLPKWQSIHMPDFSLFGDAHIHTVPRPPAVRVRHDSNNSISLVLHTIRQKSRDAKKFPLNLPARRQQLSRYRLERWRARASWVVQNLLAHPNMKIQVWDN